MDQEKALDEAMRCLGCKDCMEVCDTFIVSKDELKSPYGRLGIAKKVFNGEDISEEEVLSLYTCTLCGICDISCCQEIPISKVIHQAKFKLVEEGKAPLNIHKKIMTGITKKDNSVAGEPENRVDWVPEIYRENEIFDAKQSDTLLFLGCMSSFRVKKSASASYELLKTADYDFKIWQFEPCCGEYTYSSGYKPEAEKIFNENYERFKEQGIKKIIVTCAGCLYAFNNVYPEYIDNFDIEIKHITQIINELREEDKLSFEKIDENSILYFDSCRMGRKIKNMDIYEEPRQLLGECSEVKELKKNRKYSPCCGAGSGLRGVEKELTIGIGSAILDEAEPEKIVAPCPLCVFNLRYVNFKSENQKEIQYITDYLLERLKK